MSGVRLRRMGIGGAVALLLHALLIWGLSSFNSQTPLLVEAPVGLNVEIWPDLSRMNTRSSKIQTLKSHRITKNDKAPEPIITEMPDTPATISGAAPGESSLVSALKTRQACQMALAEGKELPAACPRSNRDIAALPSLPKDKAAHWDNLVAAKETYRRYKTSAGNTDYWRRVTGLRNYRDDTLRPGAYSDPKWQKFFNPDINPDSAHQRERDGN